MVDVKRCCVCKEEKELDAFHRDRSKKFGRAGGCKPCLKKRRKEWHDNNPGVHAEKTRRWREKNVEKNAEKDVKYNMKYPERKTAVNAVGIAIMSGKIIRAEKCEQCGSERNIQGHHEDYSKKLEVMWLCCSCHVNLHCSMGANPSPRC